MGLQLNPQHEASERGVHRLVSFERALYMQHHVHRAGMLRQDRNK